MTSPRTTSEMITFQLAQAMPWMATDYDGSTHFYARRPEPTLPRSTWNSQGPSVFAHGTAGNVIPGWRECLFRFNPILNEWEKP